MIGGSSQPLIILLETAIVFILRIGFADADDCTRIDEARDVVDMTVGVVAGDAFTEPNEMGNTERILEKCFNLLPGQIGIAILIE